MEMQCCDDADGEGDEGDGGEDNNDDGNDDDNCKFALLWR